MVGKDAVDELFDVVARTPPAGGSDEADGPDEVDIVVRVHVQPGAGRTAVVGRHGDALKVRVAAAPEGGRANEAVAELLATTLGVPKSAVGLVSGATSRSKRFRVGPIELDVVRRLLLSADSTFKARRTAPGGNAGGGRGVR